MENIILGRNETDLKELGEQATIPLGKHYVSMEREKSLANSILLDINKPHVILISGKRGSGKSWTLGVIAEGLASLQSELRQNISAVIFDTMGIYWTMKHPNYRNDKLLRSWQMKPTALKPRIFVPSGLVEEYEKKKLPVDFPLSVSASDLEARDWCSLFGIDFNSSAGILIERAILNIKRKRYSANDIIDKIKSDDRASEEDKNLAIARFEAVDKWSFFSEQATNFDRIFAGGELSIIDLSAYNFIEDGQEIKALIIGLLAKKILKSRLLARKQEEVAEVSGSKAELKAPLVWMMIDEAHEFIPKDKETLASAPLYQLLKEGRQPGISLVLATQQPGNIHETALTQSDIVISHRLTAKPDISSLNEIMQSYLATEVQKYIDNLPKVKGAAIALDDNSEKIFPMQIAPRISWHGGGDPQAIRRAQKLFFGIK